MQLKCPACQNILTIQNKSYVCSQNHNYDIAKNGYVNLLLAQHKKSKSPGDSKMMLQNRRLFLEAGYYTQLATLISKLVAKYIGTSKVANLLDIGCGEGYYLDFVAKHNQNINICGIDIAKNGIELTAKRFKPLKQNQILAVASAYNLPFFENNFDLSLSIFSPICPVETNRVLKNNGILISVGSGAEHLSGLTNRIYEKVLPHSGNQLKLGDNFKLLESLKINENIVVENNFVEHLLAMTPYYWHASIEKQQSILQLEKLETKIHFDIKVYQKTL
jgi:23S rRNA (guanine745-N1)-methyltransferase